MSFTMFMNCERKLIIKAFSLCFKILHVFTKLITDIYYYLVLEKNVNIIKQNQYNFIHHKISL